jgi:acetyl esterase/lipase
MPSKEFLAYRDQIPTAPPMPGGAAPAGPMPGGPNAYPGAAPGSAAPDFGVPVLPPDYVPPEPVIPAGCTGGKVTVGGVTGLHVTMPGVREKAALLYLHGGGFTIGSAMTAGPLLKLFAERAGLEGYAVEYGLAPYHPFPEGVEDCVAFYKGLLDMGYTKIVVGGESAGAGLTLSLALALKDRGLPRPVALWCSSPVEGVGPAQGEAYIQDFLADSTDKIRAVYAPDADPCDPLLSPICGDFTGLPPMILQAGGGESLAAGAVRLAEKAARANVEVVLHFGQDMPHTFAMDYALYPEAAYAMDEILAFVRQWLELTP